MVRIVVFAGGGVLAVVGGALVWLGLNVTTCTMCDTDSLVTGVVLSMPVYILSIILLLYGQPSIASSVLAFALVPLLGNQIYYAIKITYVVLFLADIHPMDGLVDVIMPALAGLGKYERRASSEGCR